MDEIIRRFNQAQVRYLLIGGQTMRLEGLPRFSMDCQRQDVAFLLEKEKAKKRI